MHWSRTGRLRGDDDDDDEARRGRGWFRDTDGLFKNVFGGEKESDTERLDFDSTVSADAAIRSSSSEGTEDASASSSTSRTATTRVTAYAPRAFADLRRKFGITEETFRKSIIDGGPYVSFQSNSKGAARVGGFFFFTRDGAYMIKTIKKEEAKTFLAMLPKYHEFMKRGFNSKRSLLTRFCGMYRVKLPEEERVFVVMNAVFPPEGSTFISERFDLKGSTVGRECSAEERLGKNPVLKDLDLAREAEDELVAAAARSAMTTTTTASPSSHGINVGPRTKSELLYQLRRDAAFLSSCGVMDYSLLVGVVDVDLRRRGGKSRILRRRNRRPLTAVLPAAVVVPLRHLCAPASFLARTTLDALESTLLSTVPYSPLPYYGAEHCGVNGGSLSVLRGRRKGRKALYYLGVIDFLQPWTTRKALERELKGLILGHDRHAISCVDPEEYASRFLKFLDAHVT